MAHLWYNVRGVVDPKAFEWYVVVKRVFCIRYPGTLGRKHCSKGWVPCTQGLLSGDCRTEETCLHAKACCYIQNHTPVVRSSSGV